MKEGTFTPVNFLKDGNIHVETIIKNPHRSHLKSMENELMQAYDLDKALHYSELIPELLNKRGFKKVQSEKLEMHDGYFVNIFLDVSGFKQINDKFGHKVGDQILRAIGAEIGSQTRSKQFHTLHSTPKDRNDDLFSHQSGDEYAALLMPRGEGGKFKNASTAEQVAEIYLNRVRVHLMQGVIVTLDDGRKIKLCVFVNGGYCVRHTNERREMTFEEFSEESIAKADADLLSKKDPNSRNREVVILED
jgi:diguanylate cyclase (GGDEF)-like protein